MKNDSRLLRKKQDDAFERLERLTSRPKTTIAVFAAFSFLYVLAYGVFLLSLVAGAFWLFKLFFGA